jgi:hypothetical protein
METEMRLPYGGLPTRKKGALAMGLIIENIDS